MLSAEQKKKRLEGIGGSEISAVVGQNPYAKPIDVYLAKTEGREIEITHHMERGIFMEDGVARWYAHRTGASLREVGTVFHPKKSFVFCTPDRLSKRPDCDELDLSIKVPGPFAGEQWGEPGTDEAPGPYIIQAQWELMVLGELYGITRAEIAAPVAGDLRVYQVLSDPEFQGMLVEEAERFWRNHIVKRVPPPPDGSESFSEYMDERYTDRGPVIPANADAERFALEFRRASELEKEIKLAKELARQELGLIIGEASGLEGAFGRISFKRSKDTAKTDWQAVAQELGAPSEIIQKHTTIKPGPRVFRPTWSKE